VEAVHVGEPTLADPKRTLAPDVTKQNLKLFQEAINAGKPAAAEAPATATGVNEPPRSDQPSAAPEMGAPTGGSGVGVTVVSAPNADPNAVVKPVSSGNAAALPAIEKPEEAPLQVNEVKPGSVQENTAVVDNGKKKKKAPKVDQSEESSSKTKKKKGLNKLNPF